MTDTAPKRLRDSAAVVLIRGHDRDLEVFWVRRSDRVSFMPEFHAFLGGAVDAADAALPIAGVDEGPDRTLMACAIREALEETGVLLGVEGDTTPTAREEARQALLDGTRTLPALAARHGWTFRAADLAFAGRWQTPPFAAVRFDTVYFVARVPEGQEPTIRAGELESGAWTRPADAIALWKAGHATFAAPILWTLRALEAGEHDLAARLAAGPMHAGQPPRRIEMKWGIVLQPMRTRPLPPATHTNAYLVGESEMALVDPGSNDPAELDALFALLDTLAADGRRVTTIVATHHHPDHIAGIGAVRARTGARVGAHAGAARAVRADVTLADGDVLPLATGPAGTWDLRVLHTPGHARDHVCLYHERTRSLLTGDHVTGGAGTVIIDPPEGDMVDYLASLGRLLELPIETLFPAHGSPQGAAARRIRWLIEHRLERERQVAEALEETPRDLAALVERAYADTPRNLWPYAERSLLAHLLKLEAEGRAVREGERWGRAR